MPFFKDPTTGEIVSTEELFESAIYEKNEFVSIKSAQAKITIAPYNMPAEFVYQAGKTSKDGAPIKMKQIGGTTTWIAKFLGINALKEFVITAGGAWQWPKFQSYAHPRWNPWNYSPSEYSLDGIVNVAYLAGNMTALVNATESPDGGLYFTGFTFDPASPGIHSLPVDPIRRAFFSFLEFKKHKVPIGDFETFDTDFTVQMRAHCKGVGYAALMEISPTANWTPSSNFADCGYDEPFPGHPQKLKYFDSERAYNDKTIANIADFAERLTLISGYKGDQIFSKMWWTLPAIIEKHIDPTYNLLWAWAPPDPITGEVQKKIQEVVVDSPEFYRDSYCHIDKPFLEMAYQEDIGEKTGLASPVNIKAHYNFRLLPYENLISDNPSTGILIKTHPNATTTHTIPESILPNIYALIYDWKSDEASYRYSDLGSFMPVAWWMTGGPGQTGGTTNNSLAFLKKDKGPWFAPAIKDKLSPNLSDLVAISENDMLVFGRLLMPEGTGIAAYLNNFIKTFKDFSDGHGTFSGEWGGGSGAAYAPGDWKFFQSRGGVKSPQRQVAEKKYHIIGISADEMKNFTDEANKLKKMFPMHIDINIPAVNKGKVGKILYENNLFDIFMQNVMAALWPRTLHDMEATHSVISSEVKINPTGMDGPAVIEGAPIIKSDAYAAEFSKKAMGKAFFTTPIRNTLFYEDIIKLPLNSILQSSDLLLDLDSAPASPNGTIGSDLSPQQPINWWLQGLPSQYWEWITMNDAPEYIHQINKFRAQLHPEFSGLLATDYTLHASEGNNLMVGKPIIFGKKGQNQPNLLSALEWYTALGQIRALVNDRVRGVKEIYEGKEAYAEVLFYEIVKYQSQIGPHLEIPGAGGSKYIPLGGPSPSQSDQDNDMFAMATGPGRNFIQSIFIPNIPGQNTLNYIDTQVKFDKGYYYQIYAHTFVVGTQYELEKGLHNPKEHGGTLSQWDLSYKVKPDVSLMRIPYYNTFATANEVVKMNAVEYQDYTQAVEEDDSPDKMLSLFSGNTFNLNKLETTYMWDKPPIFPDVQFVPLYGEKNKILINANFNIGEYELNPISIMWGNLASPNTPIGASINFNKARMNQHKIQGKITFKSDDFCGQIEILRIDKKPTSYQDFWPESETRIATVGEGASNFGFIDDTLIPNKNYYYILREIDSHGNYSNPSPVYMVRIINKEAEAPYTIFKMFFMSELTEKKPAHGKKFMKYIRIQPSLKHASFPEELPAPGAHVFKFNNVQTLLGQVKDINPLSPQKVPVWGQKFRFRFTSKKTGRKFDLNLTVKDVETLEKEYATSVGEPDKYSSGKC